MSQGPWKDSSKPHSGKMSVTDIAIDGFVPNRLND